MTALRPWIKLQLPHGSGPVEWADLLNDLDAWLRRRGDGTTIFDVQPVRAALESERQAVRRDIRAVLTPEQITKYDAMLARRDSLRHAREREHGNK